MTHPNENQETGSLTALLRRFFGKSRPSPESLARELDPVDRTLSAMPDVRASAHDDGLALLHISTGRVFLCNRTGSRIWQGVMQGLSADAISEEISRDCGVACDLVRRHTFSFFFELERNGLAVRKVDHGEPN